MTTYTIGRLADQVGFSTSALRYYEATGLLTPVGRTEAGYRLYDDTALARLEFIAAAKHLGCSLDEIAELLALQEREECRPVQARLHELVTSKIGDARRRRTELAQLTLQLEAAARQLGGEAVDGPCAADCACVTARPEGGDNDRDTTGPVPVPFGRSTDPAISCTLEADDIPARLEAWDRVLGSVVDRQPLDDETGMRLRFDADAPADELLRLCQAERGCCGFFSFAIVIDGRGLTLEVRAPDAARDAVTALFG